MEPLNRVVSLVILVAAGLLVALIAAIAFVPQWAGLLPWAGFLAGLIALLQSVVLEAEPAVGRTLAWAGLLTMILMVIVAFVPR